MKVDSAGTATGPVTMIAIPNEIQRTWDDFAVDFEGNTYTATHPDRVERILLNGEQTILSQGVSSINIARPTRTIFGKGCTIEETTLMLVVHSGEDR